MSPEHNLMVGDANRNKHLLTDWERRFVEDLDNKPQDYPLSEKQAAVLERINTKIGVQ